MKLDIHPDTQFSTGNVAKMLGIEGLNATRVKMLCNKGLVPTTKTGAKGTHFSIKFRDFDKVVEAHESHRSVNKGPKYPTMEEHNNLRAICQALGERVRLLEELYDIEKGAE